MKKIAIVCGGPSQNLAPFNDKSYHIAVLGNRLDKYPRADFVFEIHDDLSQHPSEYPNWLLSYNKTAQLIVSESFPIKDERVQVYPYSDVETLLRHPLYLTSSPVYMMLWAYLNGYKHIELYGVDLSVDSFEYYHQRPCCEYWCGYLRGAGCDIIIPDESPLCKSDYVEGRDYKYGDQRSFEFERTEMVEMKEQHDSVKDQILQRINELAPYLDELEQLKSNYNTHNGASQVYAKLAEVERAQKTNKNTKVNQSIKIKN